MTLKRMMKAITWLASLTVGAAALTASAFATTPEGWSADLEKAFEEAKRENKNLLVEFTGSDWCPPCIAMRKNVFTKKEFIERASKSFILVELDFPNSDPELKKKNQQHLGKYRVDGFPTVILFDSAGKEFSRFVASKYPKTEDFLRRLDTALEHKELD